MRIHSVLAVAILTWAVGQSGISNVFANSHPSPLRNGTTLGQPTDSGECGTSSAGIALCLHCSGGLDPLIEIKNTGGTDEVLNVGRMLGNGRSQYPTDIKLAFVDAAGTRHEPNWGEPMIIGGRIDPMVLPLPSGASVSFRFHPSKDTVWFVSGQVESFKPDSHQNYTVQAEFTGKAVTAAEANLDMKGIAVMPYWTGSVSSNTIKIGP